MVISDEVAYKLFGDDNPIDKIITIEIPFGKFDYTVKGVFKKGNYKSHIDANLLLSMNNSDVGQWADAQTNWATNNIFFTYFKLKKDTDVPSFESKLPSFLERNGGEDFSSIDTNKKLFIQPVKDIYLKSSIGNELSTNGSLTYLYIFSLIAGFLLLIACINFMNLSTARSEKRAREVGVRKVMGAQKNALVFQFLGESLLMCFLALVIAIALIVLFIPVFNDLTQKNFDLTAYPSLWLWIGGITIVAGVLAGLYPAFYLSSFKPISVLKGKLINTISATSIRKGLVVFQFTVSVALILVAVVIWQQMDYIQQQDLGFKKEQQLVIPFRSTSSVQNYDALRNEILQNPSIAHVTAGSTYPGFQLVQDQFFYAEGKTMQDKVDIHFAQVYDDYIETLGYELLHGRSFTKDVATADNAIILNETAVRQLGYEVKNVVGRKVYFEVEHQKTELEVVGVVKDFHFRSLHEGISPYGIMRLTQGQPSYCIASVSGNDYNTILENVKSKWEKVNPDTPLEYSFLDQDFQRNYTREERIADIITYFTAIAIFIACLGLLGLASFTMEQRRKEVGVRRVLGASVLGITKLLSKDFLKLVLIAIVIACPISYYLGNKWLEDFAYRITISWWLFLAAGLVALFIAFATVSFQVIKAAITNPIKSLRTE